MKNIKDLSEQLIGLKKFDNYDTDKFIEALYHQVTQLKFFYNNAKKNNIEADKYMYTLKIKPKEHELVYINLGRGFPKEIMDAHWCYIIKIIGPKAIVIPATSIKKGQEVGKFRMPIISMNGNEEVNSILSFSELRSIDLQRIDIRKPYLKVATERSLIMREIINILM